MHRIWLLCLLAGCNPTTTQTYRIPQGPESTGLRPAPQRDRILAEVSVAQDALVVDLTIDHQCDLLHYQRVDEVRVTTTKQSTAKLVLEGGLVLLGGLLIAAERKSQRDCERQERDLCDAGALYFYVHGVGAIITGTTLFLADRGNVGVKTTRVPREKIQSDEVTCGRFFVTNHHAEARLRGGRVLGAYTDQRGRATLAMQPDDLAALRQSRGRFELFVDGHRLRTVEVQDELPERLSPSTIPLPALGTTPAPAPTPPTPPPTLPAPPRRAPPISDDLPSR